MNHIEKIRKNEKNDATIASDTAQQSAEPRATWQPPTLTELDLLDTATGQASSFDGIGYSGIQLDV